MEPYVVDSTILTSVNTKLIFKVCSGYLNVSFIVEAVAHEVVGLHFLVVLVVRSYHIHLLT